MYNLDFETAHETFVAWEKAHPEDPLGPVSNAAAYLFAEFDRMHILESELFIDDNRFEHRKSYSPTRRSGMLSMANYSAPNNPPTASWKKRRRITLPSSRK